LPTYGQRTRASLALSGGGRERQASASVMGVSAMSAHSTPTRNCLTVGDSQISSEVICISGVVGSMTLATENLCLATERSPRPPCEMRCSRPRTGPWPAHRSSGRSSASYATASSTARWAPSRMPRKRVASPKGGDTAVGPLRLQGTKLDCGARKIIRGGRAAAIIYSSPLTSLRFLGRGWPLLAVAYAAIRWFLALVMWTPRSHQSQALEFSAAGWEATTPS
jgi:hypothetical protein